MSLPKNSTNKSFLRIQIPFFILSLFLLFSCGTDDNENLNLDLDLPTYPYTEETFNDVNISTEAVGRVRTDNLDFTILGNLQDSVFGETRAHFYTEIGLNGLVSIPKNAVLDSFVFTLKYIGGYGNNTSTQDFSIYQLDEALSSDSQYTNLSTTRLGIKLDEKKNVAFPTSRNSLSFRVDEIWNNTNIFIGKDYSSSEDLQAAFKGFGVQATSTNAQNDGFLAYFSPSNAESGLIAYYHYLEKNETGGFDEVESKLSFDFINQSKRYSYISHDYKNAPVNKWINADSLNSYRGFVQAVGGTRVKIEIPEIEDLAKKGEIAIQKAELVLPCETSWHSNNLSPLNFLDLKTQNAGNEIVDVLDKANFYWSRSYSGSKTAYVYNITSEIQYIVTQLRRNPDFVIQPFYLQTIKNDPIAFSVGRYVVKGAASSRTDGAKLMLYYSQLNVE